MSTVGKALSLLEHFAGKDSELGLGELSRLSGFDKATTRRLLMDLAGHGFVEQNPESRLYAIGPAFLRFARIREARFPLVHTAGPVIRALSEQVGETVHLSQLSGDKLTSILVEYPARSHRVNIEPGLVLPFHSTASGLAFLSACDQTERERHLTGDLMPLTAHTVTDAEKLRIIIEETALRGFSVSAHGHEDGVVSVGAPILSPDGLPVGTVTIAGPHLRMSAAAINQFGGLVREASRTISAGLFGQPKRQSGSLRA